MKEVMWKITGIVSKLVPLLLVITLLTTAACKEEEVNCSSIEFQLQNANRDLLQAAFDGDCEEVNRLFSKIFSLLREGKNCEYVINLVADEGYSDVQSYIDYLEEERDRIHDALSC
ncbi:MAG: hypothetical protein L6Q51_11700 [Cyclobacteriaceae bacterium]|nr:hypothetical protein [Cyclobacteriaceae bacterium]